MKRKLDDDYCANTRQKTSHSVLTKRKTDDDHDCAIKRPRILSLEQQLAQEQQKNFEMQQCVTALLRKIETLEYMISMFQRNETVGSNRLVTAY
jgi:hypothetical protein